ncbi:unnamed protein product [Boreogadus saida]
MPRLLPGTLLLEGVSGVVEEVPGVEEHKGENMEDLDIIRHDIQPGRMQPGCRARDRAAAGLQPGREPGSAARSTARPRTGPQRKLKKGKKDKKGKNSFFEDLATDGIVEAEEPAVKETQGKQKKKKDRWKGRAGDPDNDDDDEQIMQLLKRHVMREVRGMAAVGLVEM